MEIEKLIARLKCPAIQSCPIDGIQPSCNACQKNVVTEAISALEQLAAYEDTGLTPEEIKSLRAEWAVNLKVLESYRTKEAAAHDPK
ncbi:MAG: hypothetical protein ACLTOU_08415 [Acutalibacter sp.]